MAAVAAVTAAADRAVHGRSQLRRSQGHGQPSRRRRTDHRAQPGGESRRRRRPRRRRQSRSSGRAARRCRRRRPSGRSRRRTGQANRQTNQGDRQAHSRRPAARWRRRRQGDRQEGAPSGRARARRYRHRSRRDPAGEPHRSPGATSTPTPSRRQLGQRQLGRRLWLGRQLVPRRRPGRRGDHRGDRRLLLSLSAARAARLIIMAATPITAAAAPGTQPQYQGDDITYVVVEQPQGKPDPGTAAIRPSRVPKGEGHSLRTGGETSAAPHFCMAAGASISPAALGKDPVQDRQGNPCPVSGITRDQVRGIARVPGCSATPHKRTDKRFRGRGLS